MGQADQSPVGHNVAGDLAAKYPQMNFADGILVLLAERMRVTDIATIDEWDFGIYRTLDGRVFRNPFGVIHR